MNLKVDYKEDDCYLTDDAVIYDNKELADLYPGLVPVCKDKGTHCEYETPESFTDYTAIIDVINNTLNKADQLDQAITGTLSELSGRMQKNEIIGNKAALPEVQQVVEQIKVEVADLHNRIQILHGSLSNPIYRLNQRPTPVKFPKNERCYQVAVNTEIATGDMCILCGLTSLANYEEEEVGISRDEVCNRLKQYQEETSQESALSKKIEGLRQKIAQAEREISSIETDISRAEKRKHFSTVAIIIIVGCILLGLMITTMLRPA